MPAHRMNREEFYDKAVTLDEAALRKALWTLYWRGSAQMRERIEAQLDPQHEAAKREEARQAPEPAVVLARVEDFVGLARSGAYLGRDRRVTPKERTRWRFMFRDLAADATSALQHENVDTAAEALALLIDLANESRGYDLFRSEDPMQAAGFVVSDAVGAMWTRMRDQHGFQGFATRAAAHLIRWESPFGWTRHGFGSVADKEENLTQVLDRFLRVPDHWETFAEQYLDALDAAAAEDQKATSRFRTVESVRADRAGALAAWHSRLIERLDGTEAAGLLDCLVTHTALAGPERTYLQAVLAHRRGDGDRARTLIAQCLKKLPGHQDFLAASRQFAKS